MSNSLEFAKGLATLLAEHKAEGVVLLDVLEAAGWTDYFVIGTCTSITHMRGLARFVDESAAKDGRTPLNHPSIKDDESWLLLDLGDVVVHIMDRTARGFYELERVWYKAKALPLEPPLAVS